LEESETGDPTTANGVIVGHCACSRLFFYARYIDWLLTTPLLLYDLAAVAGVESGETFGIIGLDILMIVAGLIGSTQTPEYRWIFWAFGMLTFVPIIYMLWNTFKTQAAKDSETDEVYGKLMYLTVITWLAPGCLRHWRGRWRHRSDD
jgi:bacteriorhodopsin